ncbi:nitrile hydratase accessory protein [Limibacillus sp. MBR-115]|uniref:nitrile hydratase accessory protein n=1 Tax=Limibacillus sp. MBR-115 TaxID=3156465 RepID=UPI003396EB5A
MSQPESLTSSDVPSSSDMPVFVEPWHAQVFALAVRLSEQGHFTWPEWAATFSEELARASAAGAPKDGSAYYDVWLTALETMLLDRNLATPKQLSDLKQAWTDAYLSTPHGAPVHLKR